MKIPYSVNYDIYTIYYEIEHDVDGNKAILKSVTTPFCEVDFLSFFDSETLSDMKFICEEDFESRNFSNYIQTGEGL